MAIRGIDHVIVIGRDLDALAGQYRALGFTVTLGGRHARATHNALVPLADGAYIELFAFWEPAPGARRWAMLEAGGGLSEFMLTSDDVAADIAAANARGVGYGAPVAGTRTRPSGVEVAWKHGPAPPGGALPYLIEDVTVRTHRVPAGDTRVHTNDVGGLARLTLAVADLERATHDYAALVRTAPPPGAANDGAAMASFAVGPHFLELCEPLAGGDGPYAAAFLGAMPMSPDPAAAAGARISVIG